MTTSEWREALCEALRIPTSSTATDVLFKARLLAVRCSVAEQLSSDSLSPYQSALAKILAEIRDTAEDARHAIALRDSVINREMRADVSAYVERKRRSDLVSRIESVLTMNGCKCPCDHDADECCPDCGVCLVCRVEAELAK